MAYNINASYQPGDLAQIQTSGYGSYGGFQPSAGFQSSGLGDLARRKMARQDRADAREEELHEANLGALRQQQQAFDAQQGRESRAAKRAENAHAGRPPAGDAVYTKTVGGPGMIGGTIRVAPGTPGAVFAGYVPGAGNYMPDRAEFAPDMAGPSMASLNHPENIRKAEQEAALKRQRSADDGRKPVFFPYTQGMLGGQYGSGGGR